MVSLMTHRSANAFFRSRRGRPPRSRSFARSARRVRYYGYRYYAPTLGRWLSRDPIGERGGRNLFLFCANNPLFRMDAQGLTGQITGIGSNGNAIYADEYGPGTPGTFVPQYDNSGNYIGLGFGLYTTPSGTKSPGGWNVPGQWEGGFDVSFLLRQWSIVFSDNGCIYWKQSLTTDLIGVGGGGQVSWGKTSDYSVSLGLGQQTSLGADLFLGSLQGHLGSAVGLPEVYAWALKKPWLALVNISGEDQYHLWSPKQMDKHGCPCPAKP